MAAENSLIGRLMEGNRRYQGSAVSALDVSPALREQTAREGQKPYAIVICCSDSRMIPEAVFSAGLGELFVIRVAGNVLDRHQLGSNRGQSLHLGEILLHHTRFERLTARGTRVGRYAHSIAVGKLTLRKW